MKVAGFSFVRNAVKLDYPVIEAITSILPICDEFVVAVGNSEDDTLGLIQSINSPKIKIIETVWDDSLRTGGRVLAVETNKAFQAISKEADWAFYIQGDEAMHEKYLDTVYRAMQDYKDNERVEGLLFNYLHFYGSYRFVADSRKWYRREIRVIRNDKNISSYRDAQGFRKTDNSKLQVKLIDATIFHYGWVREPYKMQKKFEETSKFWKDDQWIEKNIPKTTEFDYSQIDSLSLYEGTHPKVMQKRIDNMSWQFNFDIHEKKLSFKNALHYWLQKNFDLRIGEYKNYKMI
jgi:hypothetical protein